MKVLNCRVSKKQINAVTINPFVPMHPFLTPDNIRKPYGALGTNGLIWLHVNIINIIFENAHFHDIFWYQV